MAVKDYSVTRVGAGADLITWSGMEADDTGKPYSVVKSPERTIQFFGDFGSGTAKMEGSNDLRADPDHTDHANAVWFELDDLNGNIVSLTNTGGEGLAQSPVWVRPFLDGGSGGNLTAALSARKN